MIEIKIIGGAMVMFAAIFGGHGAFKRWMHDRRMARNERFKRRVEERRKRRFIENLREMDKGWDKPEVKKQNIVYKGPAEFASAWL